MVEILENIGYIEEKIFADIEKIFVRASDERGVFMGE